MRFSAKDCVFARISFCKLLISFANKMNTNMYIQTINQWTEFINSIKKMIYIMKQSHSQYFGKWQQSCDLHINQLFNLKKFFFNSKLMMTLKSQSSVKSQYDPHFDYFRKSDMDCTEQFSRYPLDAFDFFEKSKITYYLSN